MTHHSGSQAWALLAVSSEAQAGTLKDQRVWALQEAKAKRLVITRFFEGVSTGKHGARAIVSDLVSSLAALKPEDRPTWLLATRFDRIGRGESILETQVIAHKLKELGVRIWTRLSGEIKLDEPFEQLLVALQATQSAFENQVRRDKSLNIYKRKREAGLVVGNQRPYGLRLGEDGHDYPDGELAEVVKLAFKLRLSGHGYITIGHRLSDVAPPRVYKNSKYEPRVVRWSSGRVKRLLENQAYVGPIIDELTFARAQRARQTLKSTRPQRRYAWPLSGAIRCYCGRAMIGMACGSAQNRIQYYQCAATWNHGKKMRLVRADDIEKQFVSLLLRLKASENASSRFRRSGAQLPLKSLETNLTLANKQKVALERQRDKVWDMHALGLVRDEDVQKRLDAITEKLRAADERIASIEQQVTLTRAATMKDRDADALLRRAGAIYESSTPEDKRRLARTVALTVGGLCVDERNKLVVRHVEEKGRQRVRNPSMP